MFVVINSLDGSFIREAWAYCEEAGIECRVTQSDGTAATGKNSVLEAFEESSFDYAVMVDGDDFLTAHGVYTYKRIAELGMEIDALALECQYGLAPAGVSDNHGLGPSERASMDPDRIVPAGGRLMWKPKDFWMYSFSKWGEYCAKYISEKENHLRVVLISKKASKLFRFSKEFVVGEDTLMYLNYKSEFAKGNLILRHLWDEIPTYVYDNRVGGVTACNVTNWVDKLVDEYERRESLGLMSSKSVPRISIDYPADYVPIIGRLPNLTLPEPKWESIMNEEYIKRLVKILTDQRNHSQSIVAELETQILLLREEIALLRERLQEKNASQEQAS